MQEIFLAALERPRPEDREAYLDRVCGADHELRRQVNLLLKAHYEAGSVLGPGSGARAQIGAHPTPAEAPGTVIGPYKLMEQIGEGGMGLVFVAEQQRPVRRKVALKVIKPGMDTKQVIARFEAERQALALMDHPNIAKVHDGGETPSSRPYFVMELVKGVPLTEYCDQNHVPIRERLALFVPVCQAVQHAHQKGIIHRDLKPSNVLVTSHDGTPVIKVIDFGVAKAIGQQLTDKTLYTQFTQLVGTPRYMSPEQAGQSSLDVDTRTDIYALGILLYELLTGTTPLERNRLKEIPLLEILRLVREQETPRPSTRLSTLQELPAIAANRQSEPKKLRGLVRGELDWIVMRALEKDRNRRYETATNLAQDIRRYLHNEPVQAGPPSAAYRIRKFARRNRLALAVLTLIAAALVTAVVTLAVSTALVTTERNEKALALQERETALLQERAARKEAVQAKKETDRSLYVQTLARAQREREVGNVGLAEKLLDDPRLAPFRGWEWHHLKRERYGALRPLYHSSTMWGLTLSADGRLLAAGGNDGNVQLWDTRTWENVRTIHAHDVEVSHVALSPDGRFLATASADGTARIWEIATGVRLHKLDVDVGTVLFSPDGRWIISGGSESVQIWDSRSGQRVRTLSPRVDATQCMALSPDGHCLAVGNKHDSTVQLWDTADWTPLRPLGPHTGTVLGVAFRADGTQLAAACGQLGWNGREGEISIWDLATGQLVRNLRGHTGGAFAVAFAPDGLRLASGGVEDAAVKLWDLQAGQETLTLRGHADGVVGIVFSPDGRLLYSASGDRTVRGWDATPLGQGEHPEGRTLPGHDGMVTSLAYSPNHQYLASGGVDRTIKIWDAHGGQWLRNLTGHTGSVRGLAFSPDGQHLVSVSEAPEGTPEAVGQVKFWDATTWREVPVSLRDDWFSGIPLGLAFRADGRQLATLMGADIAVWDPATRTPHYCLAAARGFCQIAVAFGPAGRLASCGVDGTVSWWDLSSRGEVAPFVGLVGPSPSLAQLLAIWKATKRLPARPIPAHECRAMSIAFSPDGQVLVSAGVDGTIKFWDARTMQSLGEPLRHKGGVHSLAFGPDGKRFASAGADAAVRVWDTATRHLLLTLRGHTNAIFAVAFSPDGRSLASGGWDGTVRIWDADPPPEARRWATVDP
jgi:WD40 repeat protein/serine/threonine protein kinase